RTADPDGCNSDWKDDGSDHGEPGLYPGKWTGGRRGKHMVVKSGKEQCDEAEQVEMSVGRRQREILRYTHADAEAKPDEKEDDADTQEIQCEHCS
ncbi:hypothetical protein ADUPG1_005559, partial [Aduncisulcus paluster]